MNATIYPTILTGLGVVITLIVTMHNLVKTTQQETNRRIDDLKNDLKEFLDAKFKVVDSRFDVVDVRFVKLEGDMADVRHQVQEVRHQVNDVRREVQDVRREVQDVRQVIFKPVA
jgi:predicted  nucleic acid-binding Zn-ribbon protein